MSLPYRVSDFLVDRHPYNEPSFKSRTAAESQQVQLAFGERTFERLLSLLSQPQYSASDCIHSLRIFKDECTSQESRIRALEDNRCMSVLADILIRFSSSVDDAECRTVLTQACMCVAQLVNVPVGCIHAGKYHILPIVARIVNHPSDFVLMEHGCSIINNMCASDVGCIVYAKANITQTVLDMIARPDVSPKIASALITALSQVCQSAEHRAVVTDNPCFVSTLVDRALLNTEVGQIALCLANAAADASVKQSIAKHSPKLAHVIVREHQYGGNNKVETRLLQLVAVVSVAEIAKKECLTKGAEGTALIDAVMGCTDVKGLLSDIAVQAVRSLCEWPETKARVCAILRDVSNAENRKALWAQIFDGTRLFSAFASETEELRPV